MTSDHIAITSIDSFYSNRHRAGVREVNTIMCVIWTIKLHD